MVARGVLSGTVVVVRQPLRRFYQRSHAPAAGFADRIRRFRPMAAELAPKRFTRAGTVLLETKTGRCACRIGLAAGPSASARPNLSRRREIFFARSRPVGT